MLLDKTVHTVSELMCLKKYNLPACGYLYLYHFLSDLPEADISNEAENIYSIINDFFTKIREERLKTDVLVSMLENTAQQTAIYIKG